MPPPTPTSASTSPTLRSNAWTPHEDAACIRIMKEVCNDGYDGTDLRFKEVAKRLKQQYGIERGANGVKNQWNRRLRAIAGYEDRGRRKRSDAMETSLLKQTRKVGRRRERIEKDARVIAVAVSWQRCCFYLSFALPSFCFLIFVPRNKASFTFPLGFSLTLSGQAASSRAPLMR